jgi:hypothetical protein
MYSAREHFWNRAGESFMKVSTAHLATLIFVVGSSLGYGQTYFVNSIGDSANQNPGNGSCATGNTIEVPEFGTVDECTFRAAIEEANEASGSVEIRFSNVIPTTNGQSQILIESNLPSIENTVSILGDTHPDFNADPGRPSARLARTTTSTATRFLRFAGQSSGSLIQHMGMGGLTGTGTAAFVAIRVANVSNVTIRANDFGMNRLNSGLILNMPIEGAAIGLRSATDTIVQNNYITNSDFGVVIRENAGGNVIWDNVIGAALDDGEWSLRGNGVGVQILGNTGAENVIGGCLPGDFCLGNLIVANEIGIRINNGAQGQRIFANQIGVDPEGSDDADWGNAEYGILAFNNSNTIGNGEEFGANIIGNSGLHGIALGLDDTDSANNHSIVHNYIGVLPDGTVVGNEEFGILAFGTGTEIIDNQIRNNLAGAWIEDGAYVIQGNQFGDSIEGWCLTYIGGSESAGALIGGLEPGQGNQFENCGSGMLVVDFPQGLDIVGNRIGLDPPGENSDTIWGMLIEGSSNQDVVVGSISNPEAGANVIGNTLVGIRLSQASRTQVVGNYIGQNIDGTPLPVEFDGLQIWTANTIQFADGNVVGYGIDDAIPKQAHPPLGNVIANTGRHGIVVNVSDPNDAGNRTAEHNAIRGNRIFNTGGNGIALGSDADGSVIDPGGAAEGPNRMQNYPEFDNLATFFNEDTGMIEYSYRVRTNPENADYPLIIDFYLADGTSDAGETYLGSDSYPSSSANAFRTGTLSLPPGVNPQGFYLVATATDTSAAEGPGSGNTSQFTNIPVFLGELSDELFQDRFEED